MTLRKEKYLEQQRRWPAQGRHILAQFGEDSIVVYDVRNKTTAQKLGISDWPEPSRI